MRIVSYNVQYGIGLDGEYDIGRIADAVRGADVICLQEITRNLPQNGMRDMVAELRSVLPDYFAVYGRNFEADLGSHVKNGRAVDVHLQFGNMVLSKTPIRMSRNLLLPRSRSIGTIDFQRGAIEALVETPLGFVRFYSVHLDHRNPLEREAQLRFLRDRALSYPLEGGGLTGTVEVGFPEPPHPEAYVLAGDFNMLAGSPEYSVLCGREDHEMGWPLASDLAVDAARLAGRVGEEDTTWLDPKRPDDRSRWKRIDYVFTSAGLAGNVKSVRVDRQAVGSDHLPLWVELGQ